MPRKRPSRKTSLAGRTGVRRGALSIARSFGDLADGLGIGLALSDSAGDIHYCNATFCDVLDLVPSSSDSFLHSNLLLHLTSTSRPEFEEALSQARWVLVDGKLELLSRDGHLRMFRVSLSPFGKPGSKADVWILAHEVTELIETGKALHDSKGSVSFLSARLMQTQDAERRRMARDLHDITGQELAVILMSLTRLANGLGNPQFKAQAELAETAALVRKVENEIRTLSYLLHPPMLDELGLKSALGWFIEGFTKRSNIQVEMQIAEPLPRLSKDKEIAIFRVVQESLTNVLRHAHSSTAQIRAETHAGDLCLYVEDAGHGFPPGLLRPGKPEEVVPGVGILGMRERLQQLGGDLRIESTPRGTQVRARIPLAGDGAEPSVEVSASETQTPIVEPSPPRPFRAQGIAGRILIADDHELLRVGVRSIVETEPELEVCGEAVDGVDAVAKVRELKPDLVIMDLMMPRMGGIKAAQQIRQFDPAAKILVFTNLPVGQSGESLIRTIGCEGYVSKSRASADLMAAIRAVLAGGKFFDSKPVETQSEESR